MSYPLQEELQKTAFGELEVSEPTQRVRVGFSYSVNSRIVNINTTGIGSVTQANSMGVLSSGASASSSARFESVRQLRYSQGQGCKVPFTAIFDSPVAGAFQEVGIGDDVDSIAFGWDGDVSLEYGVLRRSNGVDNWTPQSQWNRDKADGTGILPVIDFTKGNVFKIKFQWLGFGPIYYYIENPEDGLSVLVHVDEYPNAHIEPSVYNPNFPLHAHSANRTNITDVVLRTSSMAGFIEGKDENLGIENCITNTKTGVGTSDTSIITIRNKSIFASKTNRVEVSLSIASVAVDGSKPAIFKLIKNGTIGGAPSYTDIDTNTSVIDYDVAGTTVTGGVLIEALAVGKTSDKFINLRDLLLYLEPSDTLSVCVAASSTTTDATCSISWKEEF